MVSAIFISKNITSVYYFDKQDSREKLSLSKLVTIFSLVFELKRFNSVNLVKALALNVDCQDIRKMMG